MLEGPSTFRALDLENELLPTRDILEAIVEFLHGTVVISLNEDESSLSASLKSALGELSGAALKL